MPVSRVLEACYQQLVSRIRPALPKSISMLAALDNVMKGRVRANFFVDEWPNFSALVCQYIWPRRSDVADIGAFATSSEALLSVLTDGDLVTWGKRQEFQRIEDRHADYLLKHLKPVDSGAALKGERERSVVVYKGPPEQMAAILSHDNTDDIDAIRKSLVDALMPDGFTFGKLQPHHAKMVSSHWGRLPWWPNTEPYIKELISIFQCPAIYSADDLDVPVSYIFQIPSYHQFAYTDKRFRGNKLSDVPAAIAFVNLALVEKFLPFEEDTAHPGRIAIATKLFGGTLTDYKVKDLVIDPFVDSKL